MAKALVLTDAVLATPAPQPRASQVANLNNQPPAPVVAKAAKADKVDVMPLQIRIPAAEVKAIKRAALDADQSVSDFMLACFHAAMKK